LKGDLIFADEEGVPQGHPQALTLVLLRYFVTTQDFIKFWGKIFVFYFACVD
jgi:hypothetical protein